jgi:AraC family transcriptional regulator of adaptative response/methylated-DNA-[protein]-cysteine methyltransferase
MDEQRCQRFGAALPKKGNVTEAIYDAGFGASSRAYEKSGRELGMKPGERRRHGAGVPIRFTIAPTEFGKLLVGVTERGVCAVRLGDSAAELESEFRKDFAQGLITRDDDRLATVIDQILVLTASSAPHPQIPVDVRATAFQRRVWQYLREIPRGETRSYSQVAADLGMPNSTRAVARACATNEVSLIVPCHRVIGKNGNVTGYRWGVERKRQLLEKERA